MFLKGCPGELVSRRGGPGEKLTKTKNVHTPPPFFTHLPKIMPPTSENSDIAEFPTELERRYIYMRVGLKLRIPWLSSPLQRRNAERAFLERLLPCTERKPQALKLTRHLQRIAHSSYRETRSQTASKKKPTDSMNTPKLRARPISPAQAGYHRKS